jgi:hypothetical protein
VAVDDHSRVALVEAHDNEQAVTLEGFWVRAQGWFYRRTLTYYAEAGMVYWTMGAPLDETIIINRCRDEDTYEYRVKQGTLPR